MTQRRWCDECGRMKEVEEWSTETYIGGRNFSEVEVVVTRLACGHEIVGETGVTYPRPDGLET